MINDAVMNDWKSRAVSADDAVGLIRSNSTVFVHGAAATPTPLLDALTKRRDLENVTLVHLHLEGQCGFAEPDRAPHFRSNSLFTGPGLRKPVEEGRADFTPVFLSDIPLLFTSGRVPLDAAILQLSPPDKHGFCTIGTSADAAIAASRSARAVIAEINEQMPRTHGNTIVPLASLAAFTVTDRPLPSHEINEPSAVEAQIGQIVADLVVDGATLQMGIGAIPDAVL